jgi:ribosomal protein L37E
MSRFRALLVADRCDRCGAQAYIIALKYNWELLFCAHHGHEHWVALGEKEWATADYSSQLQEKNEAVLL